MSRSAVRKTRIYAHEFEHASTSQTQPNRLSSCIISMLIGIAVGAVIDMILALMRSIMQPESGGTMIWIFVWIIGACGAIIGYRNGSKAADAYMGKTPDDANTADQFIIRVISRGIMLCIVFWGMMLLFF